MSSKGRSGVRRSHDDYPTPAWAVHRLLEALPIPGGRWLEPSAGDGSIINAVNAVRDDVRWEAREVREVCEQPLQECKRTEVIIEDFLDPAAVWKPREFDVAILNPPFSLAMPFIQRCLDMARWVCALERLNFLEGSNRVDFMRGNMPDVYVLPERPSFVGGKTDSIAYAWFVWGPIRHQGGGLIRLLASTPLHERRPKRSR